MALSAEEKAAIVKDNSIIEIKNLEKKLVLKKLMIKKMQIVLF